MVTSSRTVVTVGTTERSREKALADAVSTAAGVVVESLTTGASGRSRQEWVALAGACQSLVNMVTAAQDVAVAEVARREGTWYDDGTLGEQVHGHGAVTLDAADLVAPALGVSHAQAQRRVEQAVRLAAGRVPVEADLGEVAPVSGLVGLHAAMAHGGLDGYRAGVVAYELEEAPADVAEAVVAALSEHLAEDAPCLRRRVRRLLERISPDLLRQRAQRARASTGLRRWVAEPGVDAWFGTFPSEDAASAWAAIDRLAHDYVADGTCSSVEQARGRALTDLVTGNATVDVQVVVTVPADACPTDVATGEPDAERGEDLVQVQGARPSEPILVRRSWLTGHLARTPGRARGRRGSKRPGLPFAPCDPLTGARLDADDGLATFAYRAGAELAALVRARDGRCRFPACTVAARFCDLDHVRPWPTGRTAARNLVCLCRRHHRIKQAPGWVLRLDPDGTATWTDPTGRVRTTAPLDALHALVLRAEPEHALGLPGPAHPAAAPPAAAVPASAPPPAAAVSAGPGSPGQPCRPAEPLRPWSALETHLELRLDHHPPHRRCTGAAALRAAGWRQRARPPVHDPPPF